MLFVIALPAVLPLVGLILLLGPWERPRWLVALGWLTMWTLPAVVYQTWWWVSPDSRYSVDLASALRVFPVGLWVLMGGRSVITAFEWIAENLVSRQTTMLDNWPIYLGLATIQVAALVFVLTRIPGNPWRSRGAWLIGAAVLTNAWLAAHWPYWGS